MIWALLVILGIAVGLIVGALGAAALNRRSVKAIPGAMRSRIRVTSGAVSGLTARWPRSSGYALWVRDVLVLREGLALRTRLLAVSSASGEVEQRSVPELRRLGREQSVLALVLEDGSTVEMAVPASKRSVMVGPFLLAEGRSEHPRVPRTDAGL